MKLRLLLSLLLLFLTSCGAFKTVKNEKESSRLVENRTSTRDSSNYVEKNKEISDKITIPVSQSDDYELNKRIDEILLKLNSQKKSGGNSYKVEYDPELKQLLLELKIAQTKDEKTVVNSTESFERSIENLIQKYWSKVRIPTWWIILAVIIIFRKQIFGIISFFVPGLSQIKNISDLFKKKSIDN